MTLAQQNLFASRKPYTKYKNEVKKIQDLLQLISLTF